MVARGADINLIERHARFLVCQVVRRALHLIDKDSRRRIGIFAPPFFMPFREFVANAGAYSIGSRACCIGIALVARDLRAQVDTLVELAVAQALRKFADTSVFAIGHKRERAPDHRVVERKRGFDLVGLLRKFHQGMAAR